MDAGKRLLDRQLVVTELDAIGVERTERQRRQGQEHEQEHAQDAGHRVSSLWRKHCLTWSLTMPVACMKAYMMVVPTNLNPRFLRSLDSASDASVRTGTSPLSLRLPWTGLP